MEDMLITAAQIPSRKDSMAYDVLVHILSYLQDDYPTLYRISLANRTLRDAVAEVLYKEVTFSPHTLNLRKEEFLDGLLISARLPHNAPHVKCLEISGHLSPRPPSGNPLAARLEAAIRLWKNLHTVVLTPLNYHKDLFMNVIPLLRECVCLRNLSVNASCLDVIRAPELVKIEGLQSLTLKNPTRKILTLLPEWLGRLSPTLRGLHFSQDCGSITPGVLRSFLPHIANICAFSLGISYSLTDDDISAFLNELPHLHTLDFRYYLQLREHTVLPRLPALRRLTVRHTPFDSAEHTEYLCNWIARTAAHAPLAELRLVRAHGAYDNTNCCFDSLAIDLAQTHAGTLRVLRMHAACVTRDALRVLCARCTALEELAVAVDRSVFWELPHILAPLHCLHTVVVTTQSAGGGDVAQAQVLIDQGPPRLRRLAVDGVRWEARWTPTSPAGDVQFIVEQLPPLKAPEWE